MHRTTEAILRRLTRLALAVTAAALLGAVAASLVLLAPSPRTAEAVGPGTWTATGSMAIARQLHTATLLPSGKVLVAAGSGATGYLASAELYDDGSATPCAPGSYSATGNEPCTAAPAGSYVASAGATAPTPCAPGTYSALTGSTSCNAAPLGMYATGPGATSATPCAVGTYSAVAGATTCTPAPAGSYVPTAGATSATLCAAGTYSASAGAASCTPAPAGSYGTGPGATSATPCAAGTYSASAGATSCTPAPVNTYVASSGATSATPCAPGTWTNGATGATACVPIPPAQQLANLGTAIGQMGLPNGIANSLLAKIQAAQSSTAPASCNQLGAFINQVSAQSGKALTTQQALDLTAAAALIRGALGCR